MYIRKRPEAGKHAADIFAAKVSAFDTQAFAMRQELQGWVTANLFALQGMYSFRNHIRLVIVPESSDTALAAISTTNAASG